MITVQYEDIRTDRVLGLIRSRSSFQIVGLTGRMDSAVSAIESVIEGQGLKCRVYTYGRIAAAGAGFFSGIAGVLGAASAIGIAAHNLATINPDYEIAKHIIDSKLSVSYKK